MRHSFIPNSLALSLLALALLTFSGPTAAYSAGPWAEGFAATDSPGVNTWSRIFGATSDNAPSAAVETGDGGYLIAGYDTPGYKQRPWLLKMDAAGNIIWRQVYDRGQNSKTCCLLSTGDGNYILGGSDGLASWLLKVDGSGNPLWKMTYNIGGLTWMAPSSRGGYALAGTSNQYGPGGMNEYLMQVDRDGNLEWQTAVGIPGQLEYAKQVLPARDGGYFLVAWNGGSSGGRLLKFDGAGNLIWRRNYGGNVFVARLWAMVPSPEGGYLAVGEIWVEDFETHTEVWVLKLDEDGNILWQREYGDTPGGPTSIASGLFVVPAANGGYVIAAWARDLFAGRNLWLFQIDPQGNVLWQRAHGHAGHEYPTGLVATSDGGYLLLAKTKSERQAGTRENAWVLKLNAFGKLHLGPSCFTSVTTDESSAVVQGSLADQPAMVITPALVTAAGQDVPVPSLPTLFSECK